MINIEELRKKRFQFLRRVYELTGGDEWAEPLSTSQISKELSFDEKLTENIVQYLENERLLKNRNVAGDIGITHWGVREVEESLSNPDKPTDHFPAFNIISIGQMINSQIQQASPESTQITTISEGRYEELIEMIQSLKESIDKLSLQPQQKTDLQAEIQTIEAQMSSSKPKGTIITECLNSIKQILKGAASSAIASLLLNKIITLLAKLGGG